MENFLNLLIPNRYTKLIEDPNPDYVHQLISKHLSISVINSKKLYNIKINNKVKFEVSIEGSYEDIYTLYEHFSLYNVTFISISNTCIVVGISDLVRKIY